MKILAAIYMASGIHMLVHVWVHLSFFLNLPELLSTPSSYLNTFMTIRWGL